MPSSTALTTVQLNGTVTSFANHRPFQGCTSLVSFYPRTLNISTIPTQCFAGCTNLTGEFNFPACTANNGGGQWFGTCSKIESVKMPLITSIPEPSQAGPHIFIRESSAQITTTGSVQLHISSIYPADATVTWASSAEAKATVSAGLVSGVAAGKTNITASITEGGTTYSDTCAVTVVSAT